MKLGANPTIAYFVSIICFPGALCFDVWILNKYTSFEIRRFLTEVVLKTCSLMILASLLPWFVHLLLPTGLLRLCLVTAVCLVTSGLLIYYKGLDVATRQLVLHKIREKMPWHASQGNIGN
jgi:hypothetical protein